MRHSAPLILCLIAATLSAVTHARAQQRPTVPADQPVTTIAFGSCAYHDKPQPIWNVIAKHEPDVFLFIGDNVYGDKTKGQRADENDLAKAYAMLAANEDYDRFRKAVPILATWDDHDYGRNDNGEELPFKQASQEQFHDFFGTPKDDPRRKREGIYHAETFGPEGKRVQVILLDTRYFRSPLKRGKVDGKKGWVPDPDPDKTMLGEAQWQWLEQQLKQPADVRVIASSIEVVAEEHRFEKWANLPLERKRLFKLIADTGAEGVLFVSGDRHLTELSIDKTAGPYPMVDLTSSGLTQGNEGKVDEPNRHRVGDAFRKTNYGVIHIDWSAEPPKLTLEARDKAGQIILKHTLTLDTLQPKP